MGVVSTHPLSSAGGAGGMATLYQVAARYSLLIGREKLDMGNKFHTASLDRFGRGIQEKT